MPQPGTHQAKWKWLEEALIPTMSVVYHIFCIHNPRNLSPLRKERHDRAVEWLEAVATEEISVDGLPLLSGRDEGRQNQISLSKATVNVQTIGNMSKRKKGAGKITQSGNLPRPGQKRTRNHHTDTAQKGSV